MNFWPMVLAIVVGAGLTIQVGMNGTLGTATGSSLWAAVVNFLVGLAGLVAVALASGSRIAPGSVASGT